MKAQNKKDDESNEPEQSKPFLELSEEIPLNWRYQSEGPTHPNSTPAARERAEPDLERLENDFLTPDALPLSYQNPLLMQAQTQQERASRVSRRVSAGLIIGGILLIIPVTRVFLLGFLVELLLLMRVLTLPILVALSLWMIYRLFYQRP